MFKPKYIRVFFEADSVSSGVSSEPSKLFSAQDALDLNKKFWENVIQEMNQRVNIALEKWFSDALRYQSTDPEYETKTHKEEGVVSYEFEVGFDDFETPVVAEVIGEDPRCSPPQAHEEFRRLSDSNGDNDPRLLKFLERDNITKIYSSTLERMKSVLGWNIEVLDGYDEQGYPKKIIFSAAAKQDKTSE